MRSAAAMRTPIIGRGGCCGTCCLPALLAVVSMFVVKLFAASAIALGDWSIDWGLDEPTMETVGRPVARGTGGTLTAPPAESMLRPGRRLEPTDRRRRDDDADRRSHASLSAMLRSCTPGDSTSGNRWSPPSRPATRPASCGWPPSASICCCGATSTACRLNEVYVDQAEEYGMPPLADEADQRRAGSRCHARPAHCRSTTGPSTAMTRGDP